MAFDPLSDSTRKYRRATLGVASALIAVQTFHVRITEIPVAGIKIELADQLIPVALTLSLVYLTISFVICMVDDIINFSGATFLEEHARQSREGFTKRHETLVKYLVYLLQQYLPKGDADSIAEELSSILFVINPDAEGIFATRAADLLRPHMASLVLANTTVDEIIKNVLRAFRSARRDVELKMMTKSPFRAYYYFRLFRIYLLEAAFPILLALVALLARISTEITGALQYLLISKQ